MKKMKSAGEPERKRDARWFSPADLWALHDMQSKSGNTAFYFTLPLFFHQKLRLNLLLAVPAFQVADERRAVGPWGPLQVPQSYKLVTQSDSLGTNT